MKPQLHRCILTQRWRDHFVVLRESHMTQTQVDWENFGLMRQANKAGVPMVCKWEVVDYNKGMDEEKETGR